MIRRIGLVVACALIAIGAWWIRPQASNPPGQDAATTARAPTPAAASAPRPAPPPAPKWFSTEQDWLVHQIVTSIAAMTAYVPGRDVQTPRLIVKTERRPDEDPFLHATFVVTQEGSSEAERIAVADHIWSPGAYVPFATARLRETRQSDPNGNSTLLQDLTTLTAATLLEADRRISEQLAKDMTSPSAHEDAALLLGAFAVREYAGRLFTDLRPALCRMAAHLAIARAVRGDRPPGPNGRMADVVLAMLVGRESDALAEIRAGTKTFTTAGGQAWVRALRMRITRDWRPLRDPGSATLLEQIVYGRTVHEHRNQEAYDDFLLAIQPELTAEWSRSAVAPLTFNLGQGHAFADIGFELERQEEEQVWRALRATPWKIENLNDVPVPGGIEAGGVVHVLDWGLWAGFLQRQLCAQICAKYWHTSMLGLADDRKRLGSQMEEPFGLLTLFPVALRFISEDAETYRWSLQRAQRMPVGMITPWMWRTLRSKPWFMEKADLFLADEAWFDPLVPVGTAFDLGNRSLRENCERPASVPQIERWVAMTPYDANAVENLAWRRVLGVPTVADVRRAFGPLLEYDTKPYTRMYNYLPMSWEDHVAIGVTLCERDRNECGKSAGNLMLDGREPQAVRAYEHWIDRNPDTVAVSNEIHWLVRYYDANGQRDRALELAEAAYQTGSWSGMDVYAEQLDRLGRYDEAERVYRRQFDRYENGHEALATFLLRKFGRTRDPIHYETALKILEKVFPLGIERPPVDALPAPPNEGVLVTDVHRRAARSGLRNNDIVMMVDGIRVRSYAQYWTVSRLSHDPQMTFTVWRGNRYHQIAATVAERWLGATLRDHRR